VAGAELFGSYCVVVWVRERGRANEKERERQRVRERERTRKQRRGEKLRIRVYVVNLNKSAIGGTIVIVCTHAGGYRLYSSLNPTPRAHMKR